MRNNQKGFSAVEGLLILAIVALVAFTGWYAMNAKKRANTNLDNASKTSQTTLTKEQSAQAEVVKIEQAVRRSDASLAKAGAEVPFKVEEINGDNAKGTIGSGASATTYVVHRTGGNWEVIAKGTKPSKEVGLKYNLPAGWYSAE
jgi:uncharacterized protein HemX